MVDDRVVYDFLFKSNEKLTPFIVFECYWKSLLTVLTVDARDICFCVSLVACKYQLAFLLRNSDELSPLDYIILVDFI